jgi:uncharacterized protein (TIGR01319 family)
MDVVTVDDGQPLHEKIRKTRYLRPDMILMAGGTDGGSTTPVVQVAEIIRASEPKARFGAEYNLPVIYAGNKNASDYITKQLMDKYELRIVDNIRPTVELENSDPARNAIHELFMEHVMSHAPGYDKLMRWTSTPIMPTPMGEGLTLVQLMSEIYNVNVIGVGLGGATTNVYSSYDGKFVRTVSANLGMSYSISNVLKETGIENLLRWVPFDISEDEVSDMVTNKMLRPTTIPQTLRELILEHAVAREALRLGFLHHKFLARGLRGAHPVVTDLLTRELAGGKTYIDMLNVEILGGTGGLLSHAPYRVQSAIILIDGFQPEGFTELVQDSIFMMPHLGVLSTVHRKAAIEVFTKDCLVHVGTCIAPRGVPEGVDKELMSVEMHMPEGDVHKYNLFLGEIKLVPYHGEEKIDVVVTPSRTCDMGMGSGKPITSRVRGGVAGIILDARGRPLDLPDDQLIMRKTLLGWLKSMNAYPEEALRKYEGEI